MVVRSAPSGAVLRTAFSSSLLILGASLPIERASSRIGTTKATTTSTITMPMTQPTTQPALISDPFAEVADRLETRVHGGQPVGDGAGQLRDGLHSSGGGDERRANGPQVEDHPQQADRGDRDDQRGDDQCEPGGSRHDRVPFS